MIAIVENTSGDHFLIPKSTPRSHFQSNNNSNWPEIETYWAVRISGAKIERFPINIYSNVIVDVIWLFCLLNDEHQKLTQNNENKSRRIERIWKVNTKSSVLWLERPSTSTENIHSLLYTFLCACVPLFKHFNQQRILGHCLFSLIRCRYDTGPAIYLSVHPYTNRHTHTSKLTQTHARCSRIGTCVECVEC